MSVPDKTVQEMILKATASIPKNPEITAKMAQGAAVQPQPEQPITPPAVEPATPVEQGLDPSAVDFFGNLAADMDAEFQGIPPEPAVPVQQQPGVQPPIAVPPYEPPVHVVQPGETPESLTPPGLEPQQLEAAIEQPLVEEELRLTAEQWAASQRAQAPPVQAPVAPVEQQQFDPVELEKRAIDHLEVTEYVLSDDDKNALIAEPDKVLPRLAARMHVRMQVQLAAQLAQVLPAMIQNQIQQATKVQTLESGFFGQYPELNKPEFRSTVQESLAMIRQVNPEADRNEVMRDGAALAAVRLRTKLGGAQEPAQLPALPQNMPLVPPQHQVIQPPVAPAATQAPFTPAQSGGASEPVVPTDPNLDNIFTQLANDPDW